MIVNISTYDEIVIFIFLKSYVQIIVIYNKFFSQRQTFINL